MAIDGGRPAGFGMIGFGRIGRRLATAFADGPPLAGVLVRAAHAAAAAAALPGRAVTADLDAFLATAPGLVVECASPEALRDLGPRVLASGRDLVALSLAALIEDAVRDALDDAAAAGGARLLIAPGAIGTLDLLAAGREAGLARVLYRTAKPVSVWRKTAADGLADLDALTARGLIYHGNARDGVRLFPRNLNVAVAIALAGIGLDRTEVELIADPAARHMTHELHVESRPGQVDLVIRGGELAADADPADYTAFGVMRLIRRQFARIAI